MSINSKTFGETFPHKSIAFKNEDLTEMFDIYSAELEKVFEMCRTTGSPYPALIWWSELEPWLRKLIRMTFHESCEQRSETTNDLSLDTMLLLSALEKKMYHKLEEIFDHEYITEYEKKCEQDRFIRLESAINNVADKCKSIDDSVCHVTNRLGDIEERMHYRR